jgi:ribosome-binding factor A
VAERIRLELSELILRGELRDPRAAGALVSRVVVTDDLSLAKVYVRLLDTEVTEKRKKDLLRAFEGARGFLRREVGKRLSAKRTPDLRMYWDDGVERKERVEEILADLRAKGELGDDEGAPE